MPLKYVSSFGRFIEMLLINCEVKLKFKWPGHCVFLLLVLIMVMLILIILFLLSKTQNCVYMLLNIRKGQPRTIKLSKERIWISRDKGVGINMKQNVKTKIQQTSVHIRLCWFIQIKMAILKGIKLKGIIYQIVLSRIMCYQECYHQVKKLFMTKLLILI